MNTQQINNIAFFIADGFMTTSNESKFLTGVKVILEAYSSSDLEKIKAKLEKKYYEAFEEIESKLF